MVDINIIFNNTIVNNCFIVFCDFLVTSIARHHNLNKMCEDVGVTAKFCIYCHITFQWEKLFNGKNYWAGRTSEPMKICLFIGCIIKKIEHKTISLNIV